MKDSKFLSWIGQLFSYLVQLITGSKDELSRAIAQQTKEAVEATSAAAQAVQTSIADSKSAVTESVAQMGSNVIQAVNERSNQTAQSLEAVNSKLDTIATVESDDELRKSLQVYLPEDLKSRFNW